MTHHSVFDQLSRVARFSPTGDPDGLRRMHEMGGSTGEIRIAVGDLPEPPLDEDYFEWADLCESLAAAGETYTMMELGAGYGRWGIRAAHLAAALGIPTVDIRFVEAEPQHVAWLREELALNLLPGIKTTIIDAALTYSGHSVPFAIDYPSLGLRAENWYGQAVMAGYEATNTEELYFGKPVSRLATGCGCIEVVGMPFEEMAADLERIDLIDADPQGNEYELVAHSMPTLTAKVRRAHIETHSTEIETFIRERFREADWISVWDFACYQTNDTPYGPIEFQGGLQTWLNPRFA